MPDPVASPAQVVPPGPTESVDPKKLPPFVQIVKTPGDCQVNHNLIDPWLAVSLLDIGRQALIDSMKPKLVKPSGNEMAGLMAEMGRHA